MDSREYPWSFGGVYLESRWSPGILLVKSRCLCTYNISKSMESTWSLPGVHLESTYNPHIIPLPSYYNPNKGWTPRGVHKLEFWDCRWTPQGLHVESTWNPGRLQVDSRWTPCGLHVEVDFVTWDFFKVRNKMQHEE